MNCIKCNNVIETFVIGDECFECVCEGLRKILNEKVDRDFIIRLGNNEMKLFNNVIKEELDKVIDKVIDIK